MNSQLHQAKRPISALAGPYGHPWHPLLVSVPIGAWVASLVFDVASRFVADSGFLAQASKWLIALGVIGALVAASVGLLDLLAIPRNTRATRTALAHMSLTLTVTIVYAVNFLWRYETHTVPPQVTIGQLVMAAVSLGMLAVAGFLGSTLTYHYGVRVADERTQIEAYRRPVDGPGTPGNTDR